jgi:hypothetical protein
MVPPQSGEVTLEMKGVLPGAPSVVFAGFSDPDKLAKWSEPDGFTIQSLEFDPRVGASYRIEMQPRRAIPSISPGSSERRIQDARWRTNAARRAVAVCGARTAPADFGLLSARQPSWTAA